jgi:hypothetical protein
MTKPLSLLFLLIFLNSSAAIAQNSYTFMVDKTFSSPVGAENLLSIQGLSYNLENRFLRRTWFDESSWSGKALGISYRLGKTVLVDDVIDDFAILLQHEVYGHGARAREYGYGNIQYTFSPIFPYGEGSGTTGWEYPPGRSYSFDEDLSATIAGVEATSILSKRLQLRWLQRGSMNYRETILYSRGSMGLAGYLWFTKWGLKDSEGNDMRDYESAINEREGCPEPDQHKLTVDDMAKQSLIMGFDPFQYYSLYTLFKTYLFSGEESFEMPMIHLGETSYLPSFRLGLSPFGSEIYFDNYLVRADNVMDVYFRYGIPTFHQFWGLGFYAMNVLEAGPCTFDVGFDVWNQPALDISLTSSARSGLGGAMSFRVLVKLLETFASVGVVGEMKAKTSGYLPGEPLSDALVLRAGLSFTPR